MRDPVGPPTRSRTGLVALALGTLAFATTPGGGVAQASPYVPNMDPAYARLDALITTGCIDDVIVAERPYSRTEFADLIREAEGAAAGACSTGTGSRLDEDLAWLKLRFAEELEEGVEQTQFPALLRFREISGDMTLADSPSRPMPSTERAAPKRLDGDLNPLLQKNQGRVLANGFTTAVEGSAELVLGRHFSAQLRPRAWILHPRGETTSADLTLLQATARVVFSGVSVELGRNPVTLGHGVEGGPLLSMNARGLDMVRLSMDRPTRLPGFLRHLGAVKGSLLAADMGQNRDVPGSKLFVVRLTYRVHPNVEVGYHFLNLQGGEGAPQANGLALRLLDIFLPFLNRGEFSDRVIGGDVRVRVPAIRTTLYLNGLTTDDRDWFRQSAGGLWEDAIWLGGVRVEGMGPDGRMDAWLEARRSGAQPHGHGQFTSGLTLDRRVIGDAMGPKGTGVQGGMEWHWDENRLLLSGALERYRGDEMRLERRDDPPDYHWVLVADHPDEVRGRIEFGWRHEPARAGWRGSLRLGYEHVTLWAFEDENRDNLLVQVNFGRVF